MLNLLEKWREGAIGGLLLAALFFLVQWKQTDAELKKARLAYENPATKESVRETSSGGAEVTVTRTWKTGKSIPVPKRRFRDGDGSEMTETVAWKAPVTVTRETANESTPVPVSTIMAPIRSDRWLLSVGVNRLSSDTEGKALLAGYGWRNRFDLQAGVIRKDEKNSPWLMATLRF